MVAFAGLPRLRLTAGVNLRELSAKFGDEEVESARSTIAEFVEGGFMEWRNEFVRLTARGRLLSNEVFERFILADSITR